MEIILAAAVSFFVQWVKRDFKSPYSTIGFTILLSVIAAAVYTYMVDVNLWQTAFHILTVAGAFYTFIIARFEAPKDEASSLIDYSA